MIHAVVNMLLSSQDIAEAAAAEAVNAAREPLGPFCVFRTDEPKNKLRSKYATPQAARSDKCTVKVRQSYKDIGCMPFVSNAFNERQFEVRLVGYVAMIACLPPPPPIICGTVTVAFR